MVRGWLAGCGPAAVEVRAKRRLPGGEEPRSLEGKNFPCRSVQFGPMGQGEDAAQRAARGQAVRGGVATFGILGAAVGFAAMWLGLPMMAANEHGPWIRLATSACAALFGGTVAGLLAHGRALAAAAEAAVMKDASEALRAHRKRTLRAKLIGATATAFAGGLGYALFGVFYAQLNQDRYEWQRLDLGGPELVLSTVAGLVVGLVVWRVLRPAPFEEDDAPLDAPIDAGTPVSDEELAATARTIRAARRQETLARYGSVIAAFVMMAALAFFALPWLYDVLDAELTGRTYLFALVAGIGTGVLVNRVLSPRADLHELERGVTGPSTVETSAPGEVPSFTALLADAHALEISRKASMWRWLGLDAGRRYALAGDSVALGNAAETITSIGRLLPAWLQRYRVELRDEHGPQLTLDGGWLAASSRVAVRDGHGAFIGRIHKSALRRRYTLLDTSDRPRLELRGALLSCRRLSILRQGQKIGQLHVTRAGLLSALLAGRQHELTIELPADVPLQERQILVAGALVVDRRHF